jgi:hypothetical protein
MFGKTIFYAALAFFLILGLTKVFHKDTSDPEAVLQTYLRHLKSDNSTGMYPLISLRAKTELQYRGVQKVTDYYAYFVDNRSDLRGFDVRSRDLKDDNGRFYVTLRYNDMVGREFAEEATFYVVKEVEGWRVDNWVQGGSYHLP